MAITVTTQPRELAWTGNPMPYLLTSSATGFDTLSIRVKVKIEGTFNSGTFDEAVEIDLPANADKQASFRVDRFVKDYIDFEEIDFEISAVEAITKSIVRYRIAYAEVIDGEEGSFTDGSIRYALPGGRQFQTFPGYTEPDDYIFLTSKSQLATLYREIPDFLTVLPTATASLTLVATLHYTDGTTGTKNISLGSCTKYHPVYAPIGFDVQDYDAVTPAKTIHKISFRIGTGQIVERTVKSIPSDRYKLFYYINSLGGFDSFLAYGRYDESQVSSASFARRELAADYTANTRQDVAYNVESQRARRVRSGYYRQSELEAFADIRSINHAWELRDNLLTPITVQSGAWQLINDGEFNYQAFEMTYAQAYITKYTL